RGVRGRRPGGRGGRVRRAEAARRRAAGAGTGRVDDDLGRHRSGVDRCYPGRTRPADHRRPASRGRLRPMFTGIVEELGTVAALVDLGDAARITVRGPLVTDDARHGDSIAVNGVCLTVVDVEHDAFTADVMKETLDRSALGGLAVGDPVNLERATTLSSR